MTQGWSDASTIGAAIPRRVVGLSSCRIRDETVLWGAEPVYLSGISLAILSRWNAPAQSMLLAAFAPACRGIGIRPNVRLALWKAQAAAATIGTRCDRRHCAAQPDDADYCSASMIVRADESIAGSGGREIALTLGGDGCLVADSESAPDWAPRATSIATHPGRRTPSTAPIWRPGWRRFRVAAARIMGLVCRVPCSHSRRRRGADVVSHPRG